VTLKSIQFLEVTSGLATFGFPTVDILDVLHSLRGCQCEKCRGSRSRRTQTLMGCGLHRSPSRPSAPISCRPQVALHVAPITANCTTALLQIRAAPRSSAIEQPVEYWLIASKRFHLSLFSRRRKKLRWRTIERPTASILAPLLAADMSRQTFPFRRFSKFARCSSLGAAPDRFLPLIKNG
jgi:hypothetical protein